MATQNQTNQLVQAMRPTLVVGLGGTGQEVLVRLKARFLDTFGRDSLNVIKLVALDTRVEGFQVPLSDGKLVSLDKNSELLDIGNVPTQQVLQNLDRNFPHIKAWLPKNMPGQAIVAGAKMIRPMGRLAFFYHFKRISDYFNMSIKGMANINKPFKSGEVRAEDVAGVHIFIVSSVCGGTGSGIFLDTAYLLRHICRDLNQPNIHLTGILVLPQAFAQVPSDQIKANAYAALQEVDQFSSGSLGNNFNVTYPGDLPVSEAIRPFNITYLVDGVNEGGRTLAGMAELAPLISESIFLQISSRIGQQAGSAFDNLRSIDSSFTDVDGQSHPTSYSGFGMSSLIFPAKQIMDVCGRRFAARLINQGLLAVEPTNDVIREHVDSFLEQSQLRQDLVVAAVTRDAKGKPLMLNHEQSGLFMKGFEDLAPEEWQPQVQTRVKDLETKLGDAIRRTMDDTYTLLSNQLKTQLNDKIAGMLGETTCGLRSIDPFLDILRTILSDTSQRMDMQRREKQNTLKGFTAPKSGKIDTSTQRLASALEKWLDIGGRARKEALNDLINAYVRQFTLEFEIMQMDYTIRLLSMLITEVDGQRREHTTLIDQIKSSAEKFQKEDDERVRRWDANQGAREQNITDSRDLEGFYNRYVTDVSQQLTALVDSNAAGPIHTWRKKYPTYEDINIMLLTFAQNVFVPVAEIRLEDEVMRKRETMEPYTRLEQLRSTSIPFWSIQRARVPDGGTLLEDVAVLAVEDKDSTIFSEQTMLAGTVATTTLDKHRITVLHTRHGVPVTALAQFDDYQRIYDKYMKNSSVPLHIIPLRDTRKAREMFALGEALGFITIEGISDYKLGDPNSYTPDKQDIGKGIEQALNSFIEKTALVERVEQMLEIYVKDKGRQETRSKVDDYCDKPIADDIAESRQKIERELQKLAREYRQKYL